MRVLSFFVLAAILFTGSIGWADDTKPTMVRVAIKKAWIPVGYDDNDQIQVVVAGVLPNSCYQIGPYSVSQTSRGIEITQFAYHLPGKCSEFTVPFNRTVDLGILASSIYPVIDSTSGRTLSELGVRVAKLPAPDDYQYAPISSATILHEPTGPVLYLTGNLPSPSVRIKEIKVSMSGDVMVVLPIVEPVPGFKPLWDKLSALSTRPYFQIRKPLNHVPSGTFLLHVRALDGKGLNQLQNFVIEDDPNDEDHADCARRLLGEMGLADPQKP